MSRGRPQEDQDLRWPYAQPLNQPDDIWLPDAGEGGQMEPGPADAAGDDDDDDYRWIRYLSGSTAAPSRPRWPQQRPPDDPPGVSPSPAAPPDSGSVQAFSQLYRGQPVLPDDTGPGYDTGPWHGSIPVSPAASPLDGPAASPMDDTAPGIAVAEPRWTELPDRSQVQEQRPDPEPQPSQPEPSQPEPLQPGPLQQKPTPQASAAAQSAPPEPPLQASAAAQSAPTAGPGAVRRAAGSPRGRSTRRRRSRRSRLVLVLLSVAALVTVTAAVAVAVVLRSGAGTKHVLVTPASIGAYLQAPALAKEMKAEQLKTGIVTHSSGEATHVVDAVYEDRTGPAATAGPQILLFIGGNLSGTSAGSFISSFIGKLPGAVITDPGSLGGKAACVPSEDGRLAECAWADNDTFGVIASPTLGATGIAKELRLMRPLIERPAR